MASRLRFTYGELEKLRRPRLVAGSGRLRLYICGLEPRFQGSQGTSVLKVFDLTVASTGLSEVQAAQKGLDVDAVILSPASHATYYPGAGNLTLKVVFTRSGDERGRIVGAQAVGTDGVDKRLLVFCASGLRSYVACRMLSQHDFECANIAGGYGLYRATLMNRALAGEAAADCGL